MKKRIDKPYCLPDRADEMMEDFDRLVKAAAKVLFTLIAGVVLGYAWRMMQGF